jgi:glutamate-1-semialdehyde 2,1-aminomutase
MSVSWDFSDIDRIYTDRLRGFIPEKVFDCHAHMYRLSDLKIKGDNYLTLGPEEVGYDIWKKHTGRIVKGAELYGGLFFPMVSRGCNIDSLNDFLMDQLHDSPERRGLVLVSPDSKTDRIKGYLSDPQIIGFKPYFYFSREKPVESSSISGFLPDWIMETADKKNLIIMLHIVKRKALADRDNQDAIRKMCERYPGAKIILAHAARGFHPQNTVDGIQSLKRYDNIWFDSSSICETGALKAVIKCFGPKKLLWGTDFPDSQIHGRCVSVGDGFIWIDNTIVNWQDLIPLCEPVLFGIEELLALKEASEDLGLGTEDISNIFYNNAIDLIYNT